MSVATLTGRTVRHYRVLERLGAGGMGVVYKAEDVNLGRTAAIKFLLPGLTSENDAKQRFLVEAQAAARLDHPNICTVYESGESEDGQLFIAMAYYAGETLAHRIARGPLPCDEAVAIIRQIAQGLGVAHAAGIIHRDIKPANIIMTTAGTPKILDFGLAKSASVSLTRSNAAVGTVAYMAPEQVVGGKVTPATDVWAVGVLLFELLTGRRPFTGEYEQAVLYSVLNDSPPRIRDLRADLPQHLEDVVEKTLTKDAVSRYQSMQELLGDLTPTATGEFESPPPASPEETTARVRPVARRTSIAVLPFANLTADVENAYFADGIAEDLLTELSKISAFRVVSRTSSMQFRTRERSVRDIARTLHANVVIEGSVRRAGDRVRIAVRAVNADTDEQVWADTYDRRLEDIFAVQREVALQVASALAPGMSSAERALVGHPGTTDVEAYQLYLQGRHCLNRATEEGVHQAIDYFERAAARDSSYAQPHGGIGFAYMLLGMGHGAGRIPQREAQVRARTAIDRALAIDPLLVDARGVEACLKFMFEFDWVGAERAFRSAIQLAPDNALTHAEYGLYLSSLERYDDALVEQRQAHDLDPLHPIFMSDIASTLLRAGRYDEALAQARVLIALEPKFPMAHSTMGWAYVRKRQFDEGLHELNEAVSISPGNSLFLAQLGQAYAESGRADRAREVLEYLTELGRERYVSPYHLAYVHTGLGDHEKAIDCLEQAVEERAGSVYGIRGSFLFRELRGHPRFVAVLRRMNLA